MQTIVLMSMACLMALIVCNSLPTQGAHVLVSDDAAIHPGADQLNVGDLYGQHHAKIVRRSPEPLQWCPNILICRPGRR